jgi:hypothetical protein
MEILQNIMNTSIIMMHTLHADAAQESRRYILFSAGLGKENLLRNWDLSLRQSPIF